MEEFELKELIRMFWNKKIHIILITLIFIVIGTIYT
ncbi:MAG: Wzz/FepE/Etk N-terminal domain-containing protein, partial [Clostridia bacterium]